MQHLSRGSPARCAICGATEATAGTFPMVVGVGRVCMADGMRKVKCEGCGNEVNLLTSSKLQGRTLCLSDYMKELEKYRQHLVVSFDEEREAAASILSRALGEAPSGYVLISVRRGRNSTHVWEAEYEKEEVFQMKCS